MSTFKMNNEDLSYKNRQEITVIRFSFKYLLIGFAATLLLAGCSNSHFVEGNWDLLGLGQQMAHDNCRKQVNPNDYQACMSQVDENYDAITYE
ncbi:MAG: hypothetical protein L3J61_03555 [Ghiorsea sp.]|nr:hypothetical protein [Ghiorsea sp.]